MKVDERTGDRARKRGGDGAVSNGRDQRYWLGAPRREWLAVVFLPVAGAIVVVWLVHVVRQSDPPRTAQWLSLALGLAGGLVAERATRVSSAAAAAQAAAAARGRSAATTVANSSRAVGSAE
jgi:hypothetical protein